MSTDLQSIPGLEPLNDVTYAEHLSITERFTLFHAANPHVADALERLAEPWLARHSHASMKALFERLRWESGIQTTGDVYVLNNDFTAYYSRLLMERRPEWAGAFRTRALKAEQA